MLKKILIILIFLLGTLSIKTINKIDNNKIINKIEFNNKTKSGIQRIIHIEKPIGKIIINKISIDHNLYSINSKKNNVDENITILKESIFPDKEKSIMFIAAHSGNDKVSYFNNLDKLEINDEVVLEINNKTYTYKVYNIYEIEKNGSIYGSRLNKKQLVLTTCCPNKDNCQLIINCIEK